MSASVALSVKNLTKTFGALRVPRGISLEAYEGDVFRQFISGAQH